MDVGFRRNIQDMMTWNAARMKAMVKHLEDTRSLIKTQEAERARQGQEQVREEERRRRRHQQEVAEARVVAKRRDLDEERPRDEAERPLHRQRDREEARVVRAREGDREVRELHGEREGVEQADEHEREPLRDGPLPPQAEDDGGHAQHEQQPDGAEAEAVDQVANQRRDEEGGVRDRAHPPLEVLDAGAGEDEAGAHRARRPLRHQRGCFQRRCSPRRLRHCCCHLMPRSQPQAHQ